MKKEGEQGRKQINQYTRYGTVGLAALQAYGIAAGLEGAGNVVADPGWFFRITTVITLVGGTVFLMWLGEQITARGVGNGISLIIFAGIIAEIPSALVGTLELGRSGRLVDHIDHRIACHVGDRDCVHRFHGAGAAPAAGSVSQTPGGKPDVSGRFLASAPEAQHGRRHPAHLRFIAAAAADHGRQFFIGPGSGMADRRLLALLGRGQPLYLIFYVAMIVFFAFFYTAVVFNPNETADNLKKYGGFIPGIRPGERTAEYIDYVLTRITVVGRLLSGDCLHPAGIPDFLCRCAVLFRRYIIADRRLGDDGHRRAGPEPFAGASI